MDWMPQAVRDGIIVILVISGPLVLSAAFIGLIVGVLQAATQVQEQTIGSALKIIGVFGLIIFAGFWMYQYLNQYTARTLSSAFTFVSMQGQKAVPSGAFNGAEFDERFNKSRQAEPINQPMRVIEPEKLEDKLPTGAPPGAPVLGVPEVPKAPSLTKLAPPKPPEPPKIKIENPEIPLSDYQEPKTISPHTGDIENEQLNLLPGKPTNSKDEITIDPLLKRDNFSENKDESSDVPSWLNEE
ncbi:MAG: hypothetical protein A3B68_08315 [Candidatus Melainabacteria bacterium RIFCSPHIGHO2_02_FULL_34_12]|nr:MAG: hypothetical protein A3B68_08315 [Candidatus Melainabacteria bacterium RIFCSPHIGHO2_02_FULL_34_12]